MNHAYQGAIEEGKGFFSDEERLRRAELSTISNPWVESNSRYETQAERRYRRALEDFRALQSRKKTRRDLDGESL